MAEVGRNIPDAVFFEAHQSFCFHSIIAGKNGTHSFGFEALDQDTIEEGYEGLDRFERSLGSSLYIIITRSANGLRRKGGAYHDAI